MALRIGFLGVAHMHAYGYAHALSQIDGVECAGIWDADSNEAKGFADAHQLPSFESLDAILDSVDAVIICAENARHAEYAIAAARAGRHILCEKPLVTKVEDGEAIIEECEKAKVKLMTAFPCRYSPAYQRLREVHHNGSLGKLLALCTTNRGRCPFGWFVEPELSGGGAMIDHTVHVADLLYGMLGREPTRVYAATGNGMYGNDWEDIAMLTLEYSDGLFATLDSSWSRPQSYKTWGDVTVTAVFESGVLEVDMFGQSFDVYRDKSSQHTVAGYGSNLDRELVADFVRCLVEDQPTPIDGRAGLAATRVALAGYRSAQSRSPVEV